MIKATIKRGEISMTCEGTPLDLIAEAGVFIETLINDIAKGSPDARETERILWDMYISVLKERHP